MPLRAEIVLMLLCRVRFFGGWRARDGGVAFEVGGVVPGGEFGRVVAIDAAGEVHERPPPREFGRVPGLPVESSSPSRARRPRRSSAMAW